MATSIQENGPQTGVVIGYFATGHEAHRAINQLVDEGFLPSEIGAAFHTGARAAASHQSSGEVSESRPVDVGGTLREELGTTFPGVTTQNTRSSGSSANSDSTVIQYAALGGGAGTPFDGAGRPKPISGSSLVNTGLPSELKSELPHDSDLQSQGASSTLESSYRGDATSASPGDSGTVQRGHLASELSGSGSAVTAMPHQADSHLAGTSAKDESWGNKLKHIFGGSSAHSTQHAGKDDLRAEVRKDSQDFGTGEGDLGLNKAVRYSQPAFERSFSSYGVQPEHARHLSHRIGQGGAIVTVHAAARSAEAERILEAHGADVRFAGTTGQSELSDDSHVEVLGTVGRDYPGYFD